MAAAGAPRQELPGLLPTDERETVSSTEQSAVELSVFRTAYADYFERRSLAAQPRLLSEFHRLYLVKGLRRLSRGYECLDASRPWLCYWILHSLDLLDAVPADVAPAAASFLAATVDKASGGFGGGPMQLAHLAPTYAAVNALCIVGTPAALAVIDRPALYRFLMSLKQPDGSFCMHRDGEVDIRGVYCALSVAKLANIITPELVAGTADWLASCQTYEGGFGAVPYAEAHGGYAFCGLAAMMLLEAEGQLDLDRLVHWAVNRQMRFEGGFQGRTNKLVDGCYSFWVGGLFPLLHEALARNGKRASPPDTTHGASLAHQYALQEYVLLCCQQMDGGLVDKPPKRADYYHTCYCLSGLSSAQHGPADADADADAAPTVLGEATSNLVRRTHPIHNIRVERVQAAYAHFGKMEPVA